MDEICDKANISRKRMKLSSNVRNDLHPLSSPDSHFPSPPPVSQGRSCHDGAVVLDTNACGTVEVALRNVILASVSNSGNEDLQSTLLNLVQEWSLGRCDHTVMGGNIFSLAGVCRRLPILQDREPREILNYVFKLWELKLVNVVDMVFKERSVFAHIDLWKGQTWFLKLGLYLKISQKLLCKNPHLKTCCKSFPIEQCSLQYLRVSRLDGCCELKHLDLKGFPSLRSLVILHCPRFNFVTGWEVATDLGFIEIGWCTAYHDLPNVQYLSSLRKISVSGRKSNMTMISWQWSQFSQCAKLRRLEICCDKSLPEVMDPEKLKELKFLEYLSLEDCLFLESEA